MGRLIFITGGARSGKSSFAAKLAGKNKGQTVYIATCRPLDDEMADRIAKHRAERPAQWPTMEEDIDPSRALSALPAGAGAVIIDCLTMLVTNLMLSGRSEEQIKDICVKTVKAARNCGADVITVSNELGSGIVPENKLAREFRDTAGRMNQYFASESDEAYLLVSGLPLKLK